MKKLVIFLLIAAPFVLDAQMTYVPDDNFEQALIDLGLDTPPLNDSIPTKNIDTVTYLNVSDKNISDLTGIEDFIALKELNCSNNMLKSLDLSKNTSLTWLGCDDNFLRSLNVSKNTALDTLYCGVNPLERLDVSKNPALKELHCRSNWLFNLDVSKNIALTYLDCYSNNLTDLDVSQNTALIVLDCSYNLLSSLDVSKNTALTHLLCYHNSLRSLDVSKNTALALLYCHDNSLTSLDVSKNNGLTYLFCYENSLRSLDISKNTALTNLLCYENSLRSLDISKNTALRELDCSINKLSSLDLSKNIALYYFDARDNTNLLCIQVKDSSFASNNSKWKKDSTAHYSENCNYTGVENELKFQDAVSVVPNPASDYIEININVVILSEAKDPCFKIYNFLGEIVSGLDTPPYPLFLEGGKMQLDVSGLSPGVYFVRMGDSVQRFVKY